MEQIISPEGKKRLQDFAENRPRDEHGHFIDLHSPQPPADPIIQTTNQDPSLDAPLVSISVNNPFKKILHWLDDLRKKQTTEFDLKLKLKIPLIAWIAILGFIFGAINITQYLQNLQLTSLLSSMLSKYSTAKSLTVILPTAIPSPILLSRTGILQAAYQLNSIIPIASPAIAPSGAKEGYVLITNINQITFLIVPPNLSLNAYLNKRILVTGQYNSTTNTIQIRQDTDIQYLP